jgi:hypothetical protein
MLVIILSLELRCRALVLVNTSSTRTLICVDVSGGAVHQWAPVKAQVNAHRPLIEALDEGKGKIIPVYAVEGIWGEWKLTSTHS